MKKFLICTAFLAFLGAAPLAASANFSADATIECEHCKKGHKCDAECKKGEKSECCKKASASASSDEASATAEKGKAKKCCKKGSKKSCHGKSKTAEKTEKTEE